MILFCFLLNLMYCEPHTPLQAKRKSVRLAIRPLVMKNIIQRDNYFPIKVEVVKGQSVRRERSFGEKRFFPLFSRTSFTVRRSWPAERERAIMPVAQPIPMAWHCICTLCWDNPNRSSSPIIRTLIIFLLDRHEHCCCCCYETVFSQQNTMTERKTDSFDGLHDLGSWCPVPGNCSHQESRKEKKILNERMQKLVHIHSPLRRQSYKKRRRVRDGLSRLQMTCEANIFDSQGQSLHFVSPQQQKGDEEQRRGSDWGDRQQQEQEEGEKRDERRGTRDEKQSKLCFLISLLLSYSHALSLSLSLFSYQLWHYMPSNSLDDARKSLALPRNTMEFERMHQRLEKGRHHYISLCLRSAFLILIFRISRLAGVIKHDSWSYHWGFRRPLNLKMCNLSGREKRVGERKRMHREVNNKNNSRSRKEKRVRKTQLIGCMIGRRLRGI